ncbi:MAG: hypothetical protein ABL885_02265 [Methylophilaceae bacterium]
MPLTSVAYVTVVIPALNEAGRIAEVIAYATDLAIAVIVGVIIAALVFAWQHAKNIEVVVSTEELGWKVYDLYGSLFFASTQNFLALFSTKDDPAEVVIDFKNARVKDHSALEAIDLLAERYTQLGKNCIYAI